MLVTELILKMLRDTLSRVLWHLYPRTTHKKNSFKSILIILEKKRELAYVF